MAQIFISRILALMLLLKETDNTVKNVCPTMDWRLGIPLPPVSNYLAAILWQRLWWHLNNHSTVQCNGWTSSSWQVLFSSWKAQLLLNRLKKEGRSRVLGWACRSPCLHFLEEGEMKGPPHCICCTAPCQLLPRAGALWTSGLTPQTPCCLSLDHGHLFFQVILQVL